LYQLFSTYQLPQPHYCEQIRPKNGASETNNTNKSAKDLATTNHINTANSPIRSCQPYNYEKANLDVQIALAAYARQLDGLTLLLFVVGIVETGIFAATLIFSIRSANAATKSANATIAAEMPIIFLSELILLEDPTIGDPTPVEGWPQKYFNPQFTFTNHGKSVARVINITWDCIVTKNLGEGRVPINEEKQLTGAVIKAAGGEFIEKDTTRIILLDKDYESIEKDGRLWIFGFIQFRDFMGNIHESWFCGAWWAYGPNETADNKAGFWEGGPPSYHRQT
jgi:hypothetical protein